jgi:hypothetical protein
MEINNTDLRIGNYVYDDAGNLSIVNRIETREFNDYNGSDEQTITVEVIGQPHFWLTNFVSGIPLTEELLLKMGFEDFDVIYSKSPDLVISKDLEWVGIYNIHLEDDIHYDCPKYIHQLQNLIYILSGRELTLS